MNIDLNNFREVSYGVQKIFFDKEYRFHDHFQHRRKTRTFPFYKNVLAFLLENPDIKIYFTLNDSVKPFRKIEQGYLIHMGSYIVFCNEIKNSTKGRIKTFLSQHVSLKDISATEADKDAYIKTNANEKNILDAIKSFNPEIQERILNSFSVIQSKNTPVLTGSNEITSDEFLKAFSKFLTDKDVQNKFIQNIPKFQTQILKSHIDFLKENLDKNETFIQNWIDADDGKYRKQRCLIFGIDYIDPKREGCLSGKRFDVLAEQNRDHHVIIELKSPNTEIFDIETKTNSNGGTVEEFRISKDLSRAIPQILGYKKWYQKASSEEIAQLGLKDKKKISRCIIIIGQNKESEVWKENLYSLRNSLTGVDICTYTDLISKLENTVQNLGENL